MELSLWYVAHLLITSTLSMETSHLHLNSIRIINQSSNVALRESVTNTFPDSTTILWHKHNGILLLYHLCRSRIQYPQHPPRIVRFRIGEFRFRFPCYLVRISTPFCLHLNSTSASTYPSSLLRITPTQTLFVLRTQAY